MMTPSAVSSSFSSFSSSSSSSRLPSLLLYVLLSLLITAPAPAAGATCVTAHFDLCENVFQTYETPNLVKQSIFVTLIPALPEMLANFTTAVPILAPDCYDVARRFLCTSFFPQCHNATVTLACRSLCHEFHEACGFFLNGTTFVDQLPECPDLPTEDCISAADAVPFDRSTVVCPSPLIPNPDPSVERQTCPGGLCCLPCPYAEYLYPTGHLRSMFQATAICNIICSFFCLAVVVIYLIIPTKRVFPQNVVMFMALSMMVVYLIFWLSLLLPNDRLLCHTPVDTSVPGNALPLCSFQGSMLVYGVLTSVLWFSVLGVNVFLHVLTKITVPDYVKYIYHGVCWGMPLISVIVLNVTKQIGTSTTPICGVPDEAYGNGALFIPAAVVMFPSFVLLLAVYVKVTQVALELKKSFYEVLKLQLRPLLFSTYAIAILIMYWSYQMAPDHPSGWEADWFYCLALGYGQDACSVYSTPYVVTLPTIGAIYILVGTIGPIGFISFILKRDVYVELVRIFTGKVLTGSGSYAMESRISEKKSTKSTPLEDEIDQVNANDSKKQLDVMDDALTKIKTGEY